MGQKQKPEVFYKVPKPPLPLLYMCVFFNYLLICNYQTTHKTEKSQSRGDMYPRSQHVGTFIYDLPSILPQARPHSHTDPCSDIRKVSSPIQAVTELTLHPEAGQHPPPLSLSLLPPPPPPPPPPSSTLTFYRELHCYQTSDRLQLIRKIRPLFCCLYI